MLESDTGVGAKMTVPTAVRCGGHTASVCGEQGFRRATPQGWTVGFGGWRAGDDCRASGRANFGEVQKHWPQVERTELTTPREILNNWRSIPDEWRDVADTPKYGCEHTADQPRGNDARARFAQREQTCLSFTAGSPPIVQQVLAPPRQEATHRISCVALVEKNVRVYPEVADYLNCRAVIPLRLHDPKMRRADEDGIHPYRIKAKAPWSSDPMENHPVLDLDKGKETTPLSELAEEFRDSSTAKLDNSRGKMPIEKRGRPISPRTDCATGFRIGGFGGRGEPCGVRIRNATRGMDPKNVLATTFKGRCGVVPNAMDIISPVVGIRAIYSRARRCRDALNNPSASMFESRQAVGFSSKIPRIAGRNLDQAIVVIGTPPRPHAIQKEHRP